MHVAGRGVATHPDPLDEVSQRAYDRRVRRPLICFVVALLALLVGAGSAYANRATLHDVRLYQVPSGSGKGDLVITARVGLRGQIPDVRRHGDAFAQLSLLLSDGTHRVRVRDRVALGHQHHLGAPARFRVEIPAKRARRLDLANGLTWTATLNRTPSRSARVSARQLSPFALMCQIMAGGVGLRTARLGMCGGAFDPAPPQAPPPPPPAPPVAFSTTTFYGLDYANSISMCVYFGGPGYTKPYVGFVQFADSIPDSSIENEAYVGNTGNGPQTFPVAADGSFSFPGTYTWLQDGPTTAVRISGSVPTSILNAAPNASTGAAIITYAPLLDYVPAPVSAPLDQSVLTSISALC